MSWASANQAVRPSVSIEALYAESEDVDKLLVEAAEAKSNRDEWNRHLHGTEELAAYQEVKAHQEDTHHAFNQEQEAEHYSQRSPGEHPLEQDERDNATFQVLARECEMLRQSRDNLQKRLGMALAELEDEKRLNREVRIMVYWPMRHFFVQLC